MNINASMQHFTAVFRAEILEAHAALVNNDTNRFSNILASINKSAIVENIANGISTVSNNLHEFKEQLKDLGPLGDIVIGLTTVAAGAMAWTGAAGIATALGISASFVVIIGFALMAIGILKALPAAWALIKGKLIQQAESY